MPKELEFILRKQFEMIGLEYSEELVKKDDWYSRHTWTQEQEDEFIKWLTEHLMKNREARAALMTFPNKRRRHCEKIAKEWVFTYGWKYATLKA